MRRKIIIAFACLWCLFQLAATSIVLSTREVGSNADWSNLFAPQLRFFAIASLMGQVLLACALGWATAPSIACELTRGEAKLLFGGIALSLAALASFSVILLAP